MTDHPIIFSAPMIRALLDGRKSMTRRLAFRDAKPAAKWSFRQGDRWLARTHWQRVKIGDRLWVRENLSASQGEFLGIKQNVTEIHYAADDEECLNPHGYNLVWQWKGKNLPSIHMPRWASRLTLVVTATRIERLQEISWDDAKAEGMHKFHGIGCWGFDPNGTPGPLVGDSARRAFRFLWDDLHGTDSWAANPETVCLTFTVHKTNIDAMPEAA